MTSRTPRIALISLALLVFTAVMRTAAAYAEAGSSINRLPSDDAAGVEFAVPAWVGVLVFTSPILFILVRAAVLNARDRRRAASEPGN